jgi:hypothetical protein
MSAEFYSVLTLFVASGIFLAVSVWLNMRWASRWVSQTRLEMENSALRSEVQRMTVRVIGLAGEFERAKAFREN